MNVFGHNLRLSVFGESHGSCMGVVIDGVPAGIPLDTEDFTADIDRRRSGAEGTTPRREADLPILASGVYNGRTTGAPLAILFRNEDTHSADYEAFTNVPRPGHADFTASVKWEGWNDPRGGGHFSGRLTLLLVAAGVVAKKIIPRISFKARLVEVGGIKIADASAADSANLPAEVTEKLEATTQEGDSLGGVVECVIENVPAGLGEPFFNSVESLLSHAVFSIPGVRGIEFGDGFSAAAMKGSEHNDPFGPAAAPLKNSSGGVNGGITNGASIVFRTAFKPTSSIAKAQSTLNIQTGEQVELKIKGRHDVCFALRTPVIVEAAAALVLADLSL
ncbi:MAG: chorismate synthase [Bacteroidales bacterium]|nr:chorismate synthase [Bacteroidales bacterium]